jgi:DNA-binding NarL/FixJ family response regulator
MHPVRVLVVDDSPLFLTIATEVLDTDPHIEIVGQAPSGHDALAQIPHVQPDVVLTDLRMPGLNGLGLTAQLNAHPDAPCVVIMTAEGDNEALRDAAAAVGADGFIDKGELSSAVLPLIHSLLD